MGMVYEGYYFTPSVAAFVPGSNFYCLDAYQVRLKDPAQVCEGRLMLAGEDLSALVSMLSMEEKPEVTFGLQDASAVLEGAGCRILRCGETLQVMLKGESEPMEEKAVKAAVAQDPQAKGDYFGTYWHEGMRRWAPYRVYIPASYDPQKKTPMVMGLHGGGGCPDSIFQSTSDRIKDAAERYHLLVIAPDASTVNSTYGCAIPPNGMKGAKADAVDPKNPENLDDVQLLHISQGQKGLDQVMALMQENYNIDLEKQYLIGNSMGGMGTLYYASQNPGVFRKICAQGAIPNMRFFDCAGLKHQQTLFVAGDQDGHGVEHLRSGCQVMKAAGVPVIYREVEGGTHSGAWVDVLDEIFDFLTAD